MEDANKETQKSKKTATGGKTKQRKRGIIQRGAKKKIFEGSNPGIIIQEIRELRKISQEALAEKCGTTKSYISRIENDSSDIRLATLIRIIEEGFGGRLVLSVKLPSLK